MPQFACPFDGCDRSFPKKQGLVMHQRHMHPKPYEPVTDADIARVNELEAKKALNFQAGADDFLADVTIDVGPSEVIDVDEFSPERPYVSPTVKAVTVIEPTTPHASKSPWRGSPSDAHDAEVGTLEPSGDEDISFLVDPDTAQGGIPFNTERARAREALEAERAEQKDVVTFVQEPPPLRSVPEPTLNVAPQPGTPPPRRRFDNVRERCRNGYPEGMDAKWLVEVVDYADQVLQLVAQPHVYDRWVERLTE